MTRPILPDAYAEIRDGGMGLAAANNEGIVAVVGTASDGPERQLTYISSLRDGVKKFGRGPLVDALTGLFSGGAQVAYALRAPATVPGVIGGTFALWVRIVAPGDPGVAKFRYSLDGGIVWSGDVTVPAAPGTYSITGRGLTLTFGGTGFVGDDLWKFSVDPPAGTVSPAGVEETGSGTLAVTAAKTAVVKSGTGTGTMTPGGSPLIEAEVQVKVVTAGGLNKGQFAYSLDGGDTWSGRMTIPSSPGKFIIPGTGIELVFSEGSAPDTAFLAGDFWQFRTDAPRMSNQDLLDCLNILYETKLDYEFVHVTGESDRSVWAACGAMADMMLAKHRYTFFVCEARGIDSGETVDEWVTSLVEDAGKFAHYRVGVVAGRLEMVDMNTGRKVDRNGGGVYCGIVAKNPVYRSPGYVMYNPVSVGLELNPYPALSEAHIQALDAARYVTFRRFVGLRGIYITNGRMMAEDISDYRYVEWLRVMNKACRRVRLAALRYVHGEADETGLAHLKAHCSQPLAGMAKDHEIVDHRVEIPPGQDIWATSEVTVSVYVVPVPIMRWIKLDIGLENPVLRALMDQNQNG